MLQAVIVAIVVAVTARASLPPSQHHVAGVPLAESPRDECGPAALAAVLQYQGEEVTAADIGREIDLPGYHGAINLDLLLWARRRGFEAWAGEGSTYALQQAIGRELPVICMVRRRGPIADRNHFVVVRGYDNARQVWFMDAGNGSEEAVSASDFACDWGECGRWMLVVEERRDGAGVADNQGPG